MAFELSVTVKNEEKKQTTKHMIYEVCTVSETDPIIFKFIDQAVKEFNGEPEDIRIKITLEVK